MSDLLACIAPTLKTAQQLTIPSYTVFFGTGVELIQLKLSHFHTITLSNFPTPYISFVYLLTPPSPQPISINAIQKVELVIDVVAVIADIADGAAIAAVDDVGLDADVAAVAADVDSDSDADANTAATNVYGCC